MFGRKYINQFHKLHIIQNCLKSWRDGKKITFWSFEPDLNNFSKLCITSTTYASFITENYCQSMINIIPSDISRILRIFSPWIFFSFFSYLFLFFYLLYESHVDVTSPVTRHLSNLIKCNERNAFRPWQLPGREKISRHYCLVFFTWRRRFWFASDKGRAHSSCTRHRRKII